MANFDHKKIDSKWIKKWDHDKTYKVSDDLKIGKKYYVLPQLPYPSGAGLHVGHAEGYTACDIFARFKRMMGYDVMQVVGWDSFGLPAENFAIKNNVHPNISTNKAIDNFRYQIKRMGISVDWDREVASHNPDYYKWTQWFFQLMYDQGLAYRSNQRVNWCPSCKTVLANDQVVDGHCERCDTDVEQVNKEVWYFKITEYADILQSDLDKVDWPKESIKRQRDWIGKSIGTEVSFAVTAGNQILDDACINIFTTRIDTIYGATFMVLSPENNLLNKLSKSKKISNLREVLGYIDSVKNKTQLQREMIKEKTGIVLKGVKAINPINNEELPVFVSDYVLGGYGTGAIMGVPAHDERDHAFAKKYKLEIREVISPVYYSESNKTKMSKDKERSRATISAVVQRKSDGKYLFVKWNKYKWVSPVIGGIEVEEDPLRAAEREVLEETGYRCKAIKKLGGIIESHFWVDHKKLWRCRLDQPVLLELLDEKQYGRSQKEIGIQTPAWMTLAEIIKQNTFEYNLIGILRFVGKDKLYTDYGRLMNSGKYNGMLSQEAIEKMTKCLEDGKIGKKKVKYRLHDWSVSRQRFWGAPIPMVYKPLNKEESELNKKYQKKPDLVVNIHAWGSDSKDVYYPWLTDQLKERKIDCITPDMPDSWKPVMEDWLKKMEEVIQKKVDNTANTVMTGRSLGSWAILKYAESHKVRKLILASPTFPIKEIYESYESFGVSKEHQGYLRKFQGGADGNIDHTKVRKNVGEIVFVLSIDDPYINLDASVKYIRRYYPFARIMRLRDSGHFDKKHGYDIFPKLLEEIVMPVRLEIKRAYFDDLPIELPKDVDFMPTGQSPLTYSKSFQKDVEQKYGKGWTREVDTLDTFICSSWYYFRYLDPRNVKEFASKKILEKWMPVDFYIGGPEHVTGHLLYSRFFTKVLYDAGYIDFDEPFIFHRHQGLILGEDNRKMSKRWGNVVSPTDVMNRHGGDTLRMYEMFMGPLEDSKSWSIKGEVGVYRFINKVWNLRSRVEDGYTNWEQTKQVSKLIKYIGKSILQLKLNTCVSKYMEFVNFLQAESQISRVVWENFIKVLAPFAPFITEELWSQLGHKDSICFQEWPKYDKEVIREDVIELPVQINGRTRGSVSVKVDSDESKTLEIVKNSPRHERYFKNKKVVRVIYIKGKIINIVLQ